MINDENLIFIHTKDYKEGFDTGVKKRIEILDRNCHSKEINNDETVQN